MARIELGEIKIQDSTTLVHEFHTDKEGEKYFKNQKLKVSYPIDITDINEGILSVPLTTYLSTIAWATGSHLTIDTLDSKMAARLESIKCGYEAVLEKANKDMKLNGEIFVENKVDIESQKGSNQEPAMLFTSGVDSMASYLLRKKESPKLINIDLPNLTGGELRNERRIENIKTFADYYNTEVYSLRSNAYGGIVDSDKLNQKIGNLGRSWWSGMAFPIVYMGLLAPLTEVENLSPIYQSSGATKEALNFKPIPNPKVVDSISWGHTNCNLVDFDMSRQDKIITIISEKRNDWPFIIFSRGVGDENVNCSECSNCMRNILSIFAGGGDPVEFGYEIDNETIATLESKFKEDLIEVSPAEAEFLRGMKQRTDANTFSGPDKVYNRLTSTRIIISDPQPSLKYRLWKKFPYPIDVITRKAWNNI